MGNSMGQPKKTLAEQIRDNQRVIKRSVRELERERNQLKTQEQKMINEIRKAAKANQMGPVKIMAKDLVRTRKYISKFLQMQSHLQGVGLRMQTIKSTEQMARSMKGCTKAMKQMNKQLDLPELNKIMQDFAEETEKMGITEDVMGDTIDDVMYEPGDEEEEAQIVAQVLDEIGVDANAILADAPSNTLQAKKEAAGAKAPAPVAEPLGDDLEMRLNALKK